MPVVCCNRAKGKAEDLHERDAEEGIVHPGLYRDAVLFACLICIIGACYNSARPLGQESAQVQSLQPTHLKLSTLRSITIMNAPRRAASPLQNLDHLSFCELGLGPGE